MSWLTITGTTVRRNFCGAVAPLNFETLATFAGVHYPHSIYQPIAEFQRVLDGMLKEMDNPIQVTATFTTRADTDEA